MLNVEAVETLVNLNGVELDWTVVDPPSVELLKTGNGGLVDDADTGVVALAAAELPVLPCIANLFAAPRSKQKKRKHKGRRNSRLESIVENRKLQSKRVQERRNDNYSVKIVDLDSGSI